jgi:hypothetical protein
MSVHCNNNLTFWADLFNARRINQIKRADIRTIVPINTPSHIHPLLKVNIKLPIRNSLCYRAGT